MCDKMNTLCFILLSICMCQISSAADTLYSSQNITDGNSLVSPSGLFELGFFTPGSSKSRYLGIWYSNIPVNPVVWVANRAAPINDTSGHLIVNTTTMSLALLNKNKTVFWSSNSTKQTNPNSTSPVVQLLDNGNLILRDENEVANSGKYLWQSFDYPSDTLLPEMKLGWDVRTGLNRKLTAWKSPDDPSPTSLTWELVQHNYPEMSMFKDDKEFIRSGPWNGVLFSGKPPMALPALNFTFVMNENEVYTMVGTMNNSALERMVVNVTDQYKRQCLIWSEAERNWTLYAGFPRDPCSNYAMCGANGNCVLDASPLCQCLTRFQPRSAEKWNLNDFSLGCERKTPLSCKKDGYVAYLGLKLPDTRYTWIDKAMNLKECKAKCSSNCSCSAYANLDVRGGGSGCAIWFGDLVDLVQVPGGDQDLYIKISAAELGGKDEKWKIGVIVASVVAVILAIFGYCYILKLRHIRSHKATQNNFEEQDEEDLELPLFDFSTIETATNRFSINNKLGEGGFGPVYKGILMDGKEIAVKRLSKSSGQGTKEFKNEVILIAKLQHRNLVKLLGCCIQGIEKLLIYEYMPNKSLNSFIFDEAGRKLLDWKTRFNIICGIGWGLLYLHEDSRLRIIHRDLKASNVLLDRNMSPKISDFGLARTIVGDQTEGNTNKVVGTYGYMAPEYAIEGQFSVKSDVFSFGILMLEIISGKKSKGFYHLNHNLNLIGNAWRLWNAGRPLELIDEFFGESCNLYEVLRSIHVSLLCVQKEPGNRPTMSEVVQMLSSETALPQPKEPGFPFLSNEASSNEMTVSLLEAR